MALIGTISGSNGTSNTAITGTLVIANTSVGFPGLPADPADIVLFTQGSAVFSSQISSNGLTVTGSAIIESNTSATALRVTQQGSGNAILVEDSANPDSTPFVVTSTGRVGVGTTTPNSYVFITGSDVTIPLLTIRSSDAAVDTLVVTSSAAAGGNVGIVTINQGNLANKRVVNITNIGGGTSGLRMEGSGLGSISFDNFNTSPQISASNKNLWFNTNGSAYDTSQVSFRFTEVNKTPTYPNQRTFVITGNTNNFKTGSYFEVEKSGSIKLLELQGDIANNALFVSGALLVTGSAFINSETNLGLVTERLVNSNAVGGTLNFDMSSQGVFYVNNATGAITANFINVPTTDLRVITPTVIVSQSASPQSITALQVNSVSQTINWANGVAPTANASKQDVYGFSLIRSGSAWKVLGQLSTYG